jgi:hypothetical protein
MPNGFGYSSGKLTPFVHGASSHRRKIECFDMDRPPSAAISIPADMVDERAARTGFFCLRKGFSCAIAQ